MTRRLSSVPCPAQSPRLQFPGAANRRCTLMVRGDIDETCRRACPLRAALGRRPARSGITGRAGDGRDPVRVGAHLVLGGRIRVVRRLRQRLSPGRLHQRHAGCDQPIAALHVLRVDLGDHVPLPEGNRRQPGRDDHGGRDERLDIECGFERLRPGTLRRAVHDRPVRAVPDHPVRPRRRPGRMGSGAASPTSASWAARW